MIYDLNVVWTPSTTSDQLLQTLTLASSLGYGTVALNHILTQAPPGEPSSPFPDVASLVRQRDGDGGGDGQASSPSQLPNILHRATMTLSDPSTSKYRLPSLVRAYDILAVRPVTAAAFQNACLTLDVALISLDLTNHFPFHFRPKPCMAAVARGVRFEISYAQVLAADQRGRANFIGNATELIRATRGRGIVISSEATGALTLRAPADVINLLSVWGLHSEKGMEGLRSVPRSVVVNEGIKRTGYRGVINVVQPAADSNKRSEEKQTDEKGAKKAKNPKRKNLGEEDGQAPSGNNSKRQAKKAKLASRAAGDTNK